MFVMWKAVRDGIVASAFIVGVQAVWRFWPVQFPGLMLGGLVVVLFYRKLDRIEAALSEERRHETFVRRRMAGRTAVVFVLVTAVLSAIGSYAVWHWLKVVE